MCVFRVHFSKNIASTDREVMSNDIDVTLPVNRVHDVVQSMAFIAADRSGWLTTDDRAVYYGNTTLLNPILRSIYLESDTSLHCNCGRQLTLFDPSSVAHTGGAFIVNLSPPPSFDTCVDGGRCGEKITRCSPASVQKIRSPNSRACHYHRFPAEIQ